MGEIIKGDEVKITYIIQGKDEEKALKEILKKKLYISNILLNKLKYTNSILVNNEPKYVNYKVKEKDVILVDFNHMNYVLYNDEQNIYYIKNKFLDKYERYDFPLDIIYEDEYLLIINKKDNMAIHPSCDNYTKTLSNAVATYLEKEEIYSIHIVTRLDKNTSGICIFAKNEYVQELFIRKKEEINLKKEYIAIVNGIVNPSHGIIEKPIARKEGSIILREINENGDFAKTEYDAIGVNNEENYSILKVKLHTGRTHQIRVHMASIGHVLLGDTLYANEYNQNECDRLIKKQALHSYKISFSHPITEKSIMLTAQIPEDMEKLMKNFIK